MYEERQKIKYRKGKSKLKAEHEQKVSSTKYFNIFPKIFSMK